MRPKRTEPDVFHAVADGNRRRLMELLSDGEKPVRHLAGQFDISFAAVSQHLAVLHRAGLVSRRAQGRQRLYRATPHALREIHDWAGRYQKFWQGRLKELGGYLDRTAGKDDQG